MSFAATVALVAAYEAIAERADRSLGLADRTDQTMSRAAPAGGAGAVPDVADRRARHRALRHLPFSAGGAADAARQCRRRRRSSAWWSCRWPSPPSCSCLSASKALPLQAMSYGLDWLVAVAGKTAEWSEGLGGMRMPPQSALLLFVAGFLWLALWRERWRLAGLVPICLALPIALSAPRPDVLVAASGEAVAVRGRRRTLSHHRRTRGRVRGRELAPRRCRPAHRRPRRALCRTSPAMALAASPACRRRARSRWSPTPDAFGEDCRLAAIVVTRLRRARPGARRPRMVIDRTVSPRPARIALYRDGGGAASRRFRVETAYPPIRRPFMPPASGRRISSAG